MRRWLVGILLNLAGSVAKDDDFTLRLALAWNAYRNAGPKEGERG